MYKFIGLVGNMLRKCWGYDGDIYAGCWLAYPLKNDGLKVSWDDEIPIWMENHVPNHQPVMDSQKIFMEF